MSWWHWLVLGLVIGAPIGALLLLAVALAVTSGRADDAARRAVSGE